MAYAGLKGTTLFEEPGDSRSTSVADRSSALDDLEANRTSWRRESPAARVALLDAILDGAGETLDAWVASGTALKGYDGTAAGIAEETGSHGATCRYVHQLRRTIRDIDATGLPRVPGGLQTDAEGRLFASVLPGTPAERLLWPGHEVQVFMRPGATPESVRADQAAAYRDPDGGSVTLVLAAGNASTLPATDLLTVLFVNLDVVLCKLNPVNEAMGPVYERMFAPLVERGVLRFVYGGREVAEELIADDRVHELVLTGSKATYDAIVWGTGEEAVERRASGERRCDKPFHCELGNVTPLIVVPGEWSERELEHQADRVAAWLTGLGGYGCLTPRAMLTWEDWPLRDRFLEAVRSSLGRVETRTPYYPGTLERMSRFQAAYPDKYEAIGAEREDGGRWGMIVGLDPSSDDTLALDQESFCGLISEIPLAAADAVAFCGEAANFANERLFGTLAGHLLVDPRFHDAHPDVVDQLVHTLDVGTVGINIWAAELFTMSTAPWGAAPGSTPEDIRSGVGFNNDPFMFGTPQKVVGRAPFTKPYDLYVEHAPGRPAVMQAYAVYAHRPTTLNLLRVLGLITRHLAKDALGASRRR